MLTFVLNSSDADSDVLADYVLALIRTEAPDEQLKANAIENLEDFLRDCRLLLLQASIHVWELTVLQTPPIL